MKKKILLLGILALLLCLLGGCRQEPEQTQPPTETEGQEETYELYWNLDKGIYAGAAEDGGSSRQPEADGYYHMRFTYEGQVVELKVKTRKMVNKIDIGDDIIGLAVDENGIVTGYKYLTQLPLKVSVYNCYVQSLDGKNIVTNTASGLDGEEIEMQLQDTTKVYDMTGTTGPIGCKTDVVFMDCVMGIYSLDNQLTHVYITNRALYMNTHEGYCQHCDKNTTWYEWIRQDRLPTAGGHYQLMHNVRSEAQNNIAANSQVCLDLNGKAILSENFSGKRIYSLHSEGAKLAIMDTSADQSGKLMTRGEISAHGGMIWVRYGEFHMYSGTIDGSEVVNAGNGTVINSSGNTLVHIHGGTIIGGTATYIYDEATKGYSAGAGGSIFINGKMIMDDGVIKNGYAQAAVVYENGNKSAKRGIGGNIFFATGSEAEINGGTITGGKAGGIAGNIYTNGKLTVSNIKITNGQVIGAGTMGGNLYVGGDAEVILNNTTITGGVARNHGGNVYNYGMLTVNGGSITNPTVYNIKTGEKMENTNTRNIFMVNGQLVLNGGFIEGGIGMADTLPDDGKIPSVTVTGNARITNDEGWSNVNIANGIVYAKNLSSKASIGITGSGIFSAPTKESYGANFFSDSGGDICYYDKCLAVGRVQCLCGGDKVHESWCDGKRELWNSWTEETKLPSASGRYYLTKDLMLEAVQGVGKDQSVVLDLNGKTVTCVPGGRIYNVINDNTSLAITDTVGGGLMNRIDTEPYAAQGGLLWGFPTSTITLYTGTLDGGTALNQSSGACVKTGGVFNMYGGTIQNGVATKSGSVTIDKTGVFNMYGGKIVGGKAMEGAGGGNLTVDGVANMIGGTIENGVADNGPGGNLFISGTVNLQGTRIIGGNANVGGSVYLSGTLNMSGGIIEKGTAKNFAGNIQVNGTMNMSGGTITGGTAKNPKSHNITVRAGKTLNMTGGTIDGYIDGWVDTQEDGSVLKANIMLSGKPVIWNENEGTGLLADTGYDLQITGPMTEGAKVLISLSGGAPETALVTAGEGYTFTEADKAAFCQDASNGENYEFILKDNALFYEIKGAKYYCVCGGKAANIGDHVCQNVKWQPWTKSDSLPSTTGNYYLTGPVNTDVAYIYQADQKITLDLCGQTVTVNAGQRGIRLTDTAGGTELSITDSTGGGIICRAQETAFNSHGGVIWFQNSEDKTMTLNLYAGTIDGGKISNTGNAMINLAQNTVFNMYGGTIQNGCGNNGGNIWTAGTMNLYGGTITGGNATAGGNIYVNDTGKLVVSGGQITYGTATPNWGGNVLMKGTMDMSGGQICDGISTNQTYKMRENLCLNANGMLNMSGGTIAGRVCVFNTDTAKVNISGSAKIYNDDGGNQLWIINGGKKLTLTVTGLLTEDAKIGINTDDTTVAFAVAAEGYTLTEADASRFIHEELEIELKDNALYFKAAPQDQCACLGQAVEVGDHICKNVNWVEWTSSNSLPVTSGSYYLTGPVTTKVNNIARPDQTVNLDLRGQTVTVEAQNRCYRITDAAGGSTLTITDSVGGGKIIREAEASIGAHGSLIWLQKPADTTKTSTFKLYAGTLDGNNVTNTGNGSILAAANTVFNMYGGTVQSGKSNYGGNVTVEGTMHLYKGSIQNGTASIGGGNVYVTGTGHLYIHEGNVTGGTGLPNWGGNLLIQGTVTMSGGIVSGGQSTNAANALRGNVCLNANGTLNMSGGTIDGQVCSFNSDNTKVGLSGKAVIWSSTGKNHLSVVEGGKTITVTVTGKLEEGAKIGISGLSSGSLTASAGGQYTLTAEDAACFLPETELKDNKLYMK